ncbi:MAG: hypothetical protein M0Z55_11520 [Peptococcaceae bacterium]|nr:hypothetical protein [Peptococcaceae bacterium]
MSSHDRIIAGIKELREMLDRIMRLPTKDSVQPEADCLKDQLQSVEEKLNDPAHGLEEIGKAESELEGPASFSDRPVSELTTNLESVDWDHGLTTGPVIRCDGVKSLYVEVLNNLDDARTVRILLFDLRKWPKQLAEHRTVILGGNCSRCETFDIGLEGLDLVKFEVQVEFLSGRQGIYVFVAGTCDNEFNLVNSNVFRHEQLTPIDT